MLVVDSSLQLVQSRTAPSGTSGLKQILALVKRSEAVPIRSEGVRVLVNVVKSLFTSSSNSTYAVPVSIDEEGDRESQKQREAGVKAVLTPENADALAKMVGRSGQYPVLVNEGLVALSLLSTQPSGGTYKTICMILCADVLFHSFPSTRCYIDSDRSRSRRCSGIFHQQ